MLLRPRHLDLFRRSDPFRFRNRKITFDPTDDHIFFRIIGSDIPTYDAVNDDFNGDGISNGDSIDQGIDPLTPPPGTIPPGQIEGLVPGHAYTLEVAQINGANPGTRAYLLDRDYRLLGNPTAPIDTFPIPITSPPPQRPKPPSPSHR